MDLLKDFAHLPFFIISFFAIVCALGMIFNPNIVRAGFTLIGSFVSIAGIYFLLNANFVGVSQILIYAVGIVLVIIFAIMLCSLKETASDLNKDEEDFIDIQRRRIFALLTSVFGFATLVYVINSQDWQAIRQINAKDFDPKLIEAFSWHYTEQIGNMMLSKYLVAFELISVLLLVVLVGVIILSKKNIEGEKS